MQRRGFIKAAAAFAMPYIIPASALGRQGVTAPSQRITLGHIGCGKIGLSLRGGFAQMEDVQVLACCDVEKLRLAEYKDFYDKAYSKRGGQQKASGIDLAEDYRELLARTDIDGVIISTPDHWHANMTIAACRAGKDVYCEKPLTHTVQEAYDVQAAVQRYGRILQTGTQQRSDANFRFAVEMVRNGRIGKVHTVNINTNGAPLFRYNLCGEPQKIFNWDRWLGPSAVQPYNSIIAPPLPAAGGWAGWRNYSDFGGGGQCDWGAHMYDIAQWGLGRDGDAPVQVIPAEKGNPEKQELTYVYADGVKMVRSRNTRFKERNGGLEFIGDKGVIYVERGLLVSDPEHLTSEPTSGSEATVYHSADHKRNFVNGMKTRQRTICNEQVGASTAIVCHLGNIADCIGQPFAFDYKSGRADHAEANRYLDPPIGSFGKGRVFYTSFGHADSIFTDKRMVQHYLSGLQYVAGDLKVDATPLPLYERMKAHTGPLYYEARLKVAELARHADDARQKAEVIDLCTRLIQDTCATDESRQTAIEALDDVFTPEVAQTVACAIGDAAVSHAALVCLLRHLDDVAFKQLCDREAGKLPDPQLINLINAMAARGASCADFLPPFALKGSPAVRLAAVQALGPCGTEKHIPLLKSMLDQGLAEACEASLLQIAARLPAAQAFEVYELLLKSGHSKPIKQAALIGAVRSNPAGGQTLIADAFAGDDRDMKKAAASASAQVPGEKMAQLLADRITAAAPAEAIVLVGALANRKEAGVPTLLENLLKRSDIALDVIEALGLAGTAKQVPALVAILASADKDQVEAAVDALSEMRSADVDAVIAAELDKAPPTAQVNVLKVCAARQTAVLAPAALRRVSSADQGVVSAALKAVAACGAQAEFTALCDFALANPEGDSVLSALTKLGRRMRKTDAVAKEVIAYAERAKPEHRSVFIQLLGRFQNRAGADYLATQLSEGSPDNELAVARVLSAWEDSAPAAALLKVCKQGRSDKARDMAFVGCAKLIANDPALSPEVRMETLTSMICLAQNDRQRIATLNGFAYLVHPGVEPLARPYLKSENKELYAAAKRAISHSDMELRKLSWRLSSSVNNKPEQLKLMVDMDPSTRWTSGAYMDKAEDMWVLVDLGGQQKIRTVTVDTTPSAGDYLRKYELYVSDSPTGFGKPVASGAGSKMLTVTCEATGRYVKIVQCGKEGPFWSIHELKINDLPAQRTGGASVDPASYTVQSNVNSADLKAVSDSNGSTSWKTGRQKQGQNIVVDLLSPRPVSTIIFDRKDPNDSYPGKLNIYCSNDPESWGDPIAIVEGAKQDSKTVAGIYPFAERYLKIEVDEEAQRPWEIGELELKE